MKTPHFCYLNGRFYNFKDEEIPLADIPEGTYIVFYDNATGRPRYIAAEYVQNPLRLLFMSEESPYAESEGEDVRQSYKAHYEFVIEELKRHTP